MSKVMLICGKICSGKTFYADKLKEKENAVLLSCDEVTSMLFDNNLGDGHDAMMQRIYQYFFQKAVELVGLNVNVILDWGFWSVADREQAKKFFRSKKIDFELHYVKVDDDTWQKNIAERNAKVEKGKGGNNFLLDERLMNILLSRWQEPTEKEIDVLHQVERRK